MRIYKDKNLTEEIEGNTLHLDSLLAGETKRVTFYLLNDDVPLTELKFFVDHEEVEIVEAPTELQTNAVGELIIEWKASVTLREARDTPIRRKAKQNYIPRR